MAAAEADGEDSRGPEQGEGTEADQHRSREWAAPPRPVWGEPTGTTAEVPAAAPVPVALSPEPRLPVVERPTRIRRLFRRAPVGEVVAVVVAVVEAAVVQAGGAVMALASRVTAPLRASTRPCTVASVSSVAEVRAMMVPTKVLDVFSVAELLTCQNTLQACAPLVSWTTLFEAVTRSDDAWKTNTAFGSPWPLRTSGLAAVILAVAAWPKA